MNGKGILAAAAALLAAMVLCASPAPAQGKAQEISLATASKGGTFYPMGKVMARLWNDRLAKKGVYCHVLVTAGSKENLDMLGKSAQLAIIQGMFGKMAVNGTGPFMGKPMANLRAICMLWPNVEHMVIDASKARTGTISDVSGLVFMLGAEGSGTSDSGTQILASVGIGRDDITVRRMGYAQAAQAFTRSQIQGANLPSGPPCQAVTQIFKAGRPKAKLLEITDEQLAAINQKSSYPGFRFVIPAGTYPGQDQDVRSIAQPTLLVCDASMPDELVHDLLNVLMTHDYYLSGAHPMGRYVALQYATMGLPIPLHPAALGYFRDKGLFMPEPGSR